MKPGVVVLAVLLLVGCAAPEKRQAPRAGTEKKFGDAVVAPLADLNLIREPIPPALAAARTAPYALPADGSCPALATEVVALDDALGTDLDALAAAGERSLADQGAEAASDAVIGAVRSTTEGVIPFRGWVRKLTGAERYAKEVAAAIAAGTIRRAFLKGLGQSAGCAPPAAPLRDAPPPAPRAEAAPRHDTPPAAQMRSAASPPRR